jgi:hypothetical protein
MPATAGPSSVTWVIRAARTEGLSPVATMSLKCMICVASMERTNTRIEPCPSPLGGDGGCPTCGGGAAAAAASADAPAPAPAPVLATEEGVERCCKHCGDSSSIMNRLSASNSRWLEVACPLLTIESSDAGIGAGPRWFGGRAAPPASPRAAERWTDGLTGDGGWRAGRRRWSWHGARRRTGHA